VPHALAGIAKFKMHRNPKQICLVIAECVFLRKSKLRGKVRLKKLGTYELSNFFTTYQTFFVGEREVNPTPQSTICNFFGTGNKAGEDSVLIWD